jgi:predicted outer membrane repeat protein
MAARHARVSWASVLLAIALLPVASAAAAPQRLAASTCADLQSQLNASAPGGTVTVSGTVSGCSLALPSHTVTLAGDGGGDDGFDGNAGGLPILSGTDVGTTTISQLFFRNASITGSGAAISISGLASPTIDHSVFTGNSATALGGAVYVSQVAGSPSSPVTFTDDTFGGGAANTAASGGAVSLILSTGAAATGNLFSGNIASTRGGGLNISWCPQCPAVPASVTQTSNVFDSNHVNGGQSTVGGGGGESVSSPGNLAVGSQNDRFVSNSVTGGLNLWGGGVYVGNSIFRGLNLAVAGNSSSGNGGGMYAGAVPASTLALCDATVAGNTVGAGASGPALAGSGSDALSLTNSIVYGNGSNPGSEISGFVFPAPATNPCTGTGTWGPDAVTFSDVCAGAGPRPGPGNICVNPLLVNPPLGDVHETAASPTIDAGSNALVPPTLTTDYEGDPRISDFSVDMGADERPKPSAVGLRSFTAERRNGVVVLSWRVGAESRMLGFDVYRSGVRVNAGLVPVRGGRYRLLDVRAPSRRTAYRLLAVLVDGRRVLLGEAVAGRARRGRPLLHHPA